jgi:hypothetical protein
MFQIPKLVLQDKHRLSLFRALRVRTAWGSPSLVAAARNLLSFALADDSRNEFFALLSDSCVPRYKKSRK